MKSSSKLVTGRVYTRAELREIFGISDATINNGIFRPKGHSSVWLFVTEEKTSDRTQYHDRLQGNQLTMQGQTMGRTDHLISGHSGRGDELLLFHRKSKFEHPGAGFVYEGEFQYVGHQGAQPTTFQLERVQAPIVRPKLTREWALEAVQGLGGVATVEQVVAFITERNPDYNVSNADADLRLLAVNSPSRTSHVLNKRPRHTDSGNRLDRLFLQGRGGRTTYELYDPQVHGVWEIYPAPVSVSRSGLSVRRVDDPIAKQLEVAQEEADAAGTFNAENVEDSRRSVLASIVRRRGQRKFREALLNAYGGACAITGCTLVEILEAAHIYGYKGEHTNVCANGLLLRADIHTLFDLKLIAICSETMKVCISPGLAGTEYADLEGRKVADTQHQSQRASAVELDRHRSLCGW